MHFKMSKCRIKVPATAEIDSMTLLSLEHILQPWSLNFDKNDDYSRRENIVRICACFRAVKLRVMDIVFGIEHSEVFTKLRESNTSLIVNENLFRS